MLIECLMELVNSRLDLGDKRKKAVKSYIGSYVDEQLSYIMRTPQGLAADDINIFFFPGVGFRCSNDTSRLGRLPMCNTFQNILNKKYQELIKTS